MNCILKNIAWLVEGVPIYGQLINSRKKSITSALKELSVATLFSIFPIWFYPIILYIGFGENFWTNAKSFVERGELFLFSSALVGPLIYSITKRYGGDDSEDDKVGGFPLSITIRFPYGIWFVLISVLICIFSAIFFGLMKVNESGPLSIELNEGSIFLVSAFLYCFTLSCFYCVSVYRLNLENVAGTFGQDTRGLMSEWENEHD